MEFFRELFKKEIVKKFMCILAIIIILYIMKGMLNIFLLTFLFAYLTYSMEKFIVNILSKHIKVNKKIVTIILYVILVVVLVFGVYKYIPIIINQCIEIVEGVSNFDVKSIVGGDLEKYITPALNQINLNDISKAGVNKLVDVATNIGKLSVNAFIALILSFFFMQDRDKIKAFMEKFNDSSISGFYKYTKYFGKNFVLSFGKVIEAQVLIAITNTCLSMICLAFLGFPQVLGLGVMIFFLSLIPVAGVIISLIPLTVIGFKVNGIRGIISVIILIVVLHTIESYILNPKFMSAKTRLPVFITFLILIVGQQFFGVWGLLLGVPLFIFLLDLVNIKP